MRHSREMKTAFYTLIALAAILPLAGCETVTDRHYWRHKEWHEGEHRGHWHEDEVVVVHR